MKELRCWKVIEHYFSITISKRNLDLSPDFLFADDSRNRAVIFVEGSYNNQFMNSCSFHTITLDMPVILWKACHSYDSLETLWGQRKRLHSDDLFCLLWLPPYSWNTFFPTMASPKGAFNDDNKNKMSDEIAIGFFIFIKTIIITLALIATHWWFFTLPLPISSKSRLQFLLH